MFDYKLLVSKVKQYVEAIQWVSVGIVTLIVISVSYGQGKDAQRKVDARAMAEVEVMYSEAYDRAEQCEGLNHPPMKED